MNTSERGWSENHPRFVVDGHIGQQMAMQLDEDLLEVALDAYNLSQDDLSDIPIIVEDEPDPVELRKMGGGTLFGSFITYVPNEGVDDAPEIKLYANPHRGISNLGIYVHLLDRFESDPVHEVISVNLSTTLIHELGHLAAYREAPINQPLPRRVTASTAIFREARLAWEQQYRKDYEELWVRSRTESIACQYPELLRLIVAEVVETE